MKMRLIFGSAILVATLGAANAQHIELKPGESLHLSQGCGDRDPVAVADGNGVVHLPTGQVIRGYPPNADICGNYPLKNAATFKCDRLHLAETRDPRFCKRRHIAGRTCKHLECD